MRRTAAARSPPRPVGRWPGVAAHGGHAHPPPRRLHPRRRRLRPPLGLGAGTAQHAPVCRTLRRLAVFGLACFDDADTYAVRRSYPGQCGSTSKETMARRSARATTQERAGIDADAVLATYTTWLKRQPLATRSRDAYLAQAQLHHVAGRLPTWGRSAHGPSRTRRGGAGLQAPRQDGQALGAVVGEPGPGRHRQLLPVPGRRPSGGAPGGAGRGRASGLGGEGPAAVSAHRRGQPVAPRPGHGHRLLLCRAGLSELAALDIADVEMSARRGRLKVRTGKGDAYREVPLNSASRKALGSWPGPTSWPLSSRLVAPPMLPSPPCGCRARGGA